MEVFLIGSFWFWFLFVVAPIIFISVALFSKNIPIASVVLFGALAATWIFTDFHIIWLFQNPWWTLTYVAGYVLFGIGWACIKWYTLSLDKLEEFLVQKENIQKQYDEPPIIAGPRSETFAQYVRHFYNFPPSPGDYKEDIYTWLVFWPLSILETLIGDYILRFAKFIYTRLVTTFDRITTHVFKDSGLVE